MSERKFLLGIDLGTTRLKAALLDYGGGTIAAAGMDLPLKSPAAGVVEINPRLWWKSTKEVVGRIIHRAGIKPREITGIGLSSQGISFTPVDKKGKSLYPAISWLDTRATEEVGLIRAKFKDRAIYRITAKRLNPGYVLPKILWLRKNQKDVFKNTYKFLMSKDYLIFKMTGNFVTDHTLAAGTLLYDLKNTAWSGNILKAFSLSGELLPEIKWSTESAGNLTPPAARYLGLATGTPVIAGGQDQKCAAFAAGIGKGTATISLGTASAISTVMDKPLIDTQRRIPTFPFVLKDKWILEGVVPTACANIEWLKDILRIKEREIDNCPPYAKKPGELFFYPHLQGTGSPHWKESLRGTFYGLTLSTSREDMMRSVREGITFEIRENMEIMETLMGKIGKVILFGGGSKNRVWQKIMADILGRDILVSGNPETAVYGAAFLAGMNLGIYSSIPPGKKRIIKYTRALSRSYDLSYKRYREIEEGLVALP